MRRLLFFLGFLLITSITVVAQNSDSLKVRETKPLFKGGDDKVFRDWVMNRFVLPKSVRGKGYSGTASATFVVDTLGKVTNVKIIKSLHPDIDRELVSLLNASPKWTPGTVDGKPVNVRYVFPLIIRKNY